ncbi:MAG TPA: hypothetical protein VJM32_00260 [Candidatus Saccharimonadales bacterium]|nr:hypothetical protein [Candidatus Saccharimonadales bacterium]
MARVEIPGSFWRNHGRCTRRCHLERRSGTDRGRIAEERAVIAARTEGRAAAAHERALKSGDGSATAKLEVLMEGYKAYLDSGYVCTFEAWLGSLSTDEL